jgi:hypothetical protein
MAINNVSADLCLTGLTYKNSVLLNVSWAGTQVQRKKVQKTSDREICERLRYWLATWVKVLSMLMKFSLMCLS